MNNRWLAFAVIGLAALAVALLRSTRSSAVGNWTLGLVCGVALAAIACALFTALKRPGIEANRGSPGSNR
jgi:hypothetical protein